MAKIKVKPVDGKTNPKPKSSTNKLKALPPVDGELKTNENATPTDTPPVEKLEIVDNETATTENIEEGKEEFDISELQDENLNNQIEVEPETNENAETSEEIETLTPEVVEDEYRAVGSAYGITLNFRKESEAKHVQAIVNELVKHGVVTDKSDFAKKCIDFCINHNAVIKEVVENKKGMPSPLQFPYPDGSDGTVYIEPKLLSKSLFEGLVNIPMCK